VADDWRAARRAAIAGAVGNFIEWYDFAAYAYLGVLLGKTLLGLGCAGRGALPHRLGAQPSR
jgi:hypothetical protein